MFYLVTISRRFIAFLDKAVVCSYKRPTVNRQVAILVTLGVFHSDIDAAIISAKEAADDGIDIFVLGGYSLLTDTCWYPNLPLTVKLRDFSFSLLVYSAVAIVQKTPYGCNRSFFSFHQVCLFLFQRLQLPRVSLICLRTTNSRALSVSPLISVFNKVKYHTINK